MEGLGETLREKDERGRRRRRRDNGERRRVL
jgi:hypothetical protein